MSYFAVAAARRPKGWAARELDLGSVLDIEDLTERLRDLDSDADLALLFVEVDDEYLAILRLDDGEDLRVFGSDAAFAEESRLGTLLLGDIERPSATLDVDDDFEADETESDGAAEATPAAADEDGDPVGDADLLTDFGIPAKRLLHLCSHEGLLPADVTTEICEVLGFADDVEELREA